MSKANYQPRYIPSVGIGIRTVKQPINIPANIEVREYSTPCFMCGVRAGIPCRHRRSYSESLPDSLTG